MRLKVFGTTGWALAALACLSACDVTKPVSSPVQQDFGADDTVPAISSQPQSVSVVVGTSAVLSVVAASKGALSYQWLKDGQPIASSNLSTLGFITVAADDAGTYSAVLTNSKGSVTSDPAVLTVTTSAVAPTISAQPTATNVVAGVASTLAVTASGTSPLSYQWMRNNVPIADATGFTLTHNPTKVTDAGNYAVKISNSAGSVTSSVAVLSVSPAIAPTITSQPASLTVAVGDTPSFTVGVSGSQPMTYTWKRGTDVIAGAGGYRMAMGNIQANAAGSYTVTISNFAGSVTSKPAILTVTTAAPASTPPAATGCASPGQPKGPAAGTYTTIGLCEDFAGSKLPAWLEPHYFWYPDKNLEYESQNVAVHDGLLDLKAEPRQCPNLYAAGCDIAHHENFSVAQANSYGLWGTKKPLQGFEYGFLQTDVKADAGRGLWTGFWCMTGDNLSDPEIDIEILTNAAGESRMNHMGVHENGYTSKTDTTVNFSDGNYHTLGLERTLNGAKADLNFYVDGSLKWSYKGSGSVGKIYCAFQNDIDAADFPNWETPPNATTFAKGPVHVYFKSFRYWKK